MTFESEKGIIMNHHDHRHETAGEMPFEEKITRLLEHWIRHNRDHAATYANWAEKAREKHMDQVANLLEEAARMNLEMNEKFEAAARQVKI